MLLNLQILLWAPIRKFMSFQNGNSHGKLVQSRSLLYQLVESEVCVADALLDLNDLTGCDQHMSTAIKLAEDLRGPENMLMHQRIRTLRQKRADFKILQPP